MSDIRYVCLSDMHFGAETSLLSNLTGVEVDPSEPSPVLTNLVKCLKTLIGNNNPTSKKPTLILNGDILELALAQDNMAAMCFERFIDLVMPEGDELFDRIVYNPGNHDHHLWETARETQYAQFIEFDPKVKSGIEIPKPWHTTNIFNFPNPVPSTFLTALLHRRTKLDKIVETAYPNFGLISSNGRKAVIFHHGHFIEDIYILMSTIKTIIFPGTPIPKDIWDLEEENFAWIDYFWSTLGRSGDVGKGVEHVYELLQDEERFNELLGNIAKWLADKFDIPLVGNTGEAKLFKMALCAAADAVRNLERKNVNGVLSGAEGLNGYLQGPLKRQIENELKGPVPQQVTFVFGHTHKPFEEEKQLDGYPGKLQLYNSGGWVVDSVKRQNLQGGSVILIDDNLECAALRMYVEWDFPDEYKVWVSEAGSAATPGAFYSSIQKLVSENRAQFEDFSEVVAQAVNVRARDLQARISAGG